MMTPHERALVAIFDLRELDRYFKDLRDAWTDLVIARMELDFL